MGKVGRRAVRQQQVHAGRLQQAEALLRRTAEAQGISLEEARAHLEALAEVRAQHEAALEGSGMTVKDVRYDAASGNVEVIVQPITIDGEPRGWSEAARARLGVLRGQLEGELLGKGRARVAQIELGRTFGGQRLARGAMLALVAPDVLKAAAPARAIPRSLTVSLVEDLGTGEMIIGTSTTGAA